MERVKAGPPFSEPGPLRIKRIYDPPAVSDGARILVDRVWPRGISKEKAALHLWLKEIAPTTALRKWFGHDPERWTEFQARYLEELRHNAGAVAQLVEITNKGSATLLYGAHDEKHNHALVILQYLSEEANRA